MAGLRRSEVATWTLDAVTGGAAFVVNGRLDLLAANQLARAVFTDLYASAAQPPGLLRTV